MRPFGDAQAPGYKACPRLRYHRRYSYRQNLRRKRSALPTRYVTPIRTHRDSLDLPDNPSLALAPQHRGNFDTIPANDDRYHPIVQPQPVCHCTASIELDHDPDPRRNETNYSHDEFHENLCRRETA